MLLDGSRSLDNALDLALDLAEKYSAEVLLLSVVSTTVYPFIHRSDRLPAPAEAVVKDEKRHLDLCEQSCTLCYEGRFPAEPQAERPAYIT